MSEGLSSLLGKTLKDVDILSNLIFKHRYQVVAVPVLYQI